MVHQHVIMIVGNFDGPDATSPSLGQFCNVLTGSPGVITTRRAVTILSSDGGLERLGSLLIQICTFLVLHQLVILV